MMKTGATIQVQTAALAVRVEKIRRFQRRMRAMAGKAAMEATVEIPAKMAWPVASQAPGQPAAARPAVRKAARAQAARGAMRAWP
jgi:hypothetical protein